MSKVNDRFRPSSLRNVINIKKFQLEKFISVNDDVLSSLTNLMTNTETHIEDEQMKADKDHFGPLAGLNGNYVKVHTTYHF